MKIGTEFYPMVTGIGKQVKEKKKPKSSCGNCEFAGDHTEGSEVYFCKAKSKFLKANYGNCKEQLDAMTKRFKEELKNDN